MPKEGLHHSFYTSFNARLSLLVQPTLVEKARLYLKAIVLRDHQKLCFQSCLRGIFPS